MKLGQWFYKDVVVNGRKGYVVGYDEQRLQILFQDSPPDEPEWVLFGKWVLSA